MTSRTTPAPRRTALAFVLTPLLLGGLVIAALAGLGLLSGARALPALGGASGTAADGEIPAGERVTVHDTDLPAIANLDPELLAAVQRAAADAAAEGEGEFLVTSGWRSPDYQQRLLDDAVRVYGSEAEAARWVARPETSRHVSGDAIDIGPFDATYWLSLHGAAYGLCQIYANETWHFELRPEAVTKGCPEPYLDPTYDPRLRA